MERVKYYAKTILKALKYLHSKGIAHRNIHSRNMLCEVSTGFLRLGGICSKLVYNSIKDHILVLNFGDSKSSLIAENSDIDVGKAEKEGDNYKCDTEEKTQKAKKLDIRGFGLVMLELFCRDDGIYRTIDDKLPEKEL